ncbi:PREDICTED: uncharacterized protein LOC105502070 isoform X2 [Colobus angolensis palliatus]|uniref:uncharacterized protein LOC105502070 isoform X2 n=1 Tax=Colobus angolensis palliatus TaxID=336983 RepID=UPI0005F44307|nr:PREDICTED: uncharacterized protein LOC105502070 isoform X2 [Colobus angolensis palliatus]
MKRFVGTKEGQTSKCWPSSPWKMRPPPAPSLHLPTVTVSFTRRAARERKREASEIPEWIDRCYVIGAASSTPQEARSWGERGSPAAGATRTVSPPHRSLELDIQEEAASFVFWCHRRWPLMAFGLSALTLVYSNCRKTYIVNDRPPCFQFCDKEERHWGYRELFPLLP